jgi:hypothetical protein
MVEQEARALEILCCVLNKWYYSQIIQPFIFFLKKTQNMVLYSDILVDNPAQYCNFKIFYIYINLYINFKLNKR